MHYFEFNKRDATIYSGATTSSRNTGLDEILEINKEVAENGSVQNISRILIDFDYSFISQSIQSGKIPESAKYFLNLYDATSEEVEAEQNVFVYMVSGSNWKQWTGKLDHNPVTQDGEYSVSASYGLTFDRKDLRVDVSDLVKNHIYSSSLFPNRGFLVKRESLYTGSSDFSFNPGGDTTKDESSSDRLGNLKYFSRETHTIYPPKLEVVWDDSSFSTGSLSALSSTDLERLKIYFKNLRPEYKEDSVVKFRLVGRELFPTTTFETTPSELTVKFLPSASAFYEVRDAETEEVIIPYGSGSKISCDSSGNFFNLMMNGLQSERNYRFCIKVVSGSGTTDEQINFYDEDNEFRVVR